MNTIRMFTVVFCVIFAGFDLVADVGVASQPSADEKERIAEEQSAILDTIAQINHINWVWNAAKTYNNSIVLAEEYDKISPGNLNFNRIPDEEILKRIKEMLDTLHSLSANERELRHWRHNFNESRSLKLNTYYLKASKNAVETITSHAKGFSWNVDLAVVAQTAWNIAHYCASLHNDYENFVYELDKEMTEKHFAFDTDKMEILHKQNTALLHGQWQLIHRYRLDDRLRVSDADIKMLLSALKDDLPSRIYTRLTPMRERFSLFPEFWYYFSCVAMETGHFKEGIEACDTFFRVNRGIFRDDPMEGTVALNKAFMLPKTDANKDMIRDCLEIAWRSNIIRGDWQLDYLVAIMYKGVFNDQTKAEMILEHAITLIESAVHDRQQYGAKAGVTLERGLSNCRNALHQLRGEPLEETNEMAASLVKTQNVVVDDDMLDPIHATNNVIFVYLPNDKHIKDWSKYTLQLLRRGNVDASIGATITDCGIDTNGAIRLAFAAPFSPSRCKIDEYRLTYNNTECPVQWTFRSLWHYWSDVEMDNFYEEVLNIMRSKSMLARIGIWLASDNELVKLKQSFIESCCFDAWHYSVSINGKVFFYMHSLSSLYNCNAGNAESKDDEIILKGVNRLCMELEGKRYSDLDDFVPLVKQMAKDVWRELIRKLD